MGIAFAAEQPTLMPLPDDAFDPRVMESRRVDQRARVSIRQCHYSVPARYAGRRLTVQLGATTVQVLDAGKIVATHTRAIGRYVQVLTLDHYLKVLARKPGAFPAPPRWLRPRQLAPSPDRTRPTGTQPAPRVAMPAARGR